MPPLTMEERVLPSRCPVPPTALGQAPLKLLQQVLGKAVLQPPGPGVPAGRVSPHVPLGRVTCPLLWAAALGGRPAVLSITEGIAPASLQHDRLNTVA